MPNLFSSQELSDNPEALKLQNAAELKWAQEGMEDTTEDGRTFVWALCAYCDGPYRHFSYYRKPVCTSCH